MLKNNLVINYIPTFGVLYMYIMKGIHIVTFTLINHDYCLINTTFVF